MSSIDRDIADELLSARLIRIDHGAIHPLVRINVIGKDILICTDLCSYREIDQVFPIHAEQMLLMDHMLVREGQDVLELGVGSGVLSVYAARARSAGHVWAAEISERAIRFARFNARLNGVEDRVTVVNSDWFAAFAGRTFDVVYSNPPFEPTPPNRQHFQHSSAGADGLAIVRRILNDYRPFLKRDGVLQAVTYSPSRRDRLLLADLLTATNADFQILCHPNPIGFGHFMSKYSPDPEGNRQFDELTLAVASVARRNGGPIGRRDGGRTIRLTPEQVSDYPDILNPIGMTERAVTTVDES